MNKLVKWTCITASLFVLMSVISYAGETPAEREIKKLINKRTDVMESVLFGQITYEEGCRQLKEIEIGSLYDEDVEQLRVYRNSDCAKTERTEFINVKQKTQMYDKTSFEVKIKWTEYYGQQRCSNLCIYDVGAQVRDGDYKLTTFKIQKDLKTY